MPSLRADELAGPGAERRSSRGTASIRPRSRTCRWAASRRSASRAGTSAGWRRSSPAGRTRCAGTTVDRQCGSSMQSELQRGGGDLVGPARRGRLGGRRDRCRACRWARTAATSPTELLERWEIVPQGISAEVIAEEWGLSREELDAYSLESHRRALAAIDEGRFENEIVPVEVHEPARRASSSPSTRRRGATRPPRRWRRCSPRSCPREGDGRELEPDLRRRGRGAGRERGARARGSGSSRARGSSRSGSPASIRTGCCTATRRRRERALARAGLGWDDVAVIEVNEAFASVVLQFVRDAGLEERLGGRQPERRRDLARPSARRHRRAHHRDAAERARAPRRALRRRDDVHRLRPGDRRGHRAGLSRFARRRPRRSHTSGTSRVTHP